MYINLLDFFKETAVKNADKIAVKHNAQSISFAELQQKAIKLA